MKDSKGQLALVGKGFTRDPAQFERDLFITIILFT